MKDQQEILVLQPPESFEGELAALSDVLVVRDLTNVEKVNFVLAFVTRQAELDEISTALAAKAEGDALIWIAYPKGSSKKYTCEFNRDSGWRMLGEAGFEGVRIVAIDEDWSALRFRRVEYIKSMKRDPKRALSAKGKERTSG